MARLPSWVKRRGIRFSETLDQELLHTAALMTLRDLVPQLANMARGLIPTDSGDLAGTLRYEIDEKTATARVIAGNKEIWYGRFVEYGTIYQTGRPFMQVGMDTYRKQFTRTMRQNIKKLLAQRNSTND
jgi:HK97 gp10 family phage protein